ncbi:MAG: bifunctional (p)ppGpp synthetase/guanosine-3',5'-bis(diphosphate) 3'-pyrophosphohydrolase [Gemmatimonadota bacterium]|nr:bifunctional (p)ppGpp synthetase/guanosine-3',5'-bis(diphosphate) 3'-pyrophosphohydrolase [Gemmatimonadota bacterium]
MPKESLFKLLSGIKGLDLELIERVYNFGAMAHQGQKRDSGEDYITHTDAVVRILIDLNLYDSVSIAAALIHDVVEDTGCPQEDIRKNFGEEISVIVDGLTKIGRMDGYAFRSAQEKQVENYRKLILSMAKDIRVILIKFADRLHNMRTLDALPMERRRRIARETLDIYAPLAHRFGIALIRWELEDLAFKHLEGERYRELARKLTRKRKDRESLVEQFRKPLQKVIDDAEINAEVIGRPKHLYSIYKKMEDRSKTFGELYDLLGLRVLTHSVADCYYILGIVHSTWTPVHERFKDYIATPKTNMYQSLHTTVFGPEGQMIEVQIRTHEMHRTAEYGIAAHWKFKEDRHAGSDLDKRISWLRELLEWQEEATDPGDFMELFKVDLFHDEVFVFTPKGQLIKLPAGSTIIDFAFAVHTEIGMHCSGGKIDGRIAPLHTRLKSGQRVDIIKNPNTNPSKDWLQFVRTSRARSKIRSWIRKQEYADSVKLGREMLEREFKRQRRQRVNDSRLKELMEHLKLKGPVEKVYEAVGQGHVSISHIMNFLFPEEEHKKREKNSTFDRLVDKIRKTSSGIRLQGIGNLMVTYAGCCQPVPGDKVVGYITRGRGVSIHRADCPNLLRMKSEKDRRVLIDWKAGDEHDFIVRLLVSGSDRKGVLADMTSAITDSETNINSASIKVKDYEFSATFLIEVKDLKHLNRVMSTLKKIRGIEQVLRREYFSSKEMENRE